MPKVRRTRLSYGTVSFATRRMQTLQSKAGTSTLSETLPLHSSKSYTLLRRRVLFSRVPMVPILLRKWVGKGSCPALFELRFYWTRILGSSHRRRWTSERQTSICQCPCQSLTVFPSLPLHDLIRTRLMTPSPVLCPTGLHLAVVFAFFRYGLL